MKTALICVVTGAIYEKFAEDLFGTAEKFFHPTEEVELLMLPGRPGWPEATMYRYHALRDHLMERYADQDYVYMSDADMLFESHVGAEVLPLHGLAATLHPGFTHSKLKPFETNLRSAAFIPRNHTGPYFCGGFIGGTTQETLSLADQIAAVIDADRANGLTPVWHDESALNRVLAFSPPEIVLSPSYCYPDDDSWYRTVWEQPYERKLVALDKTEGERGNRG